MDIFYNLLSINFIILNQWMYWVILLGAILESIPLIGLFIPGMTLVILGGFLSKLGILKIYSVILIASMGAILGDLIGYIIGKKYGYSFISKYGRYFLIKRAYFKKIKKLMNRHSGKALILGRFNSLTRAFTPFIAGSTNLSFSRFLVYNIAGGISWALSFVLIGYIFGKSYEIISKYVGRFIFLAIILSIMIIYSYKFINKRRHIFSKKSIYILILNIFSLYLFSKITEDIINKDVIINLDLWINSNIIHYQNIFINKVMILITNILSPINLSILSIILFGILLYRRRTFSSLILIFSMAGGLLLELLAKYFVHRLRPENSLINVLGYSFPSGHATLSIIFFSSLIYLFKNEIKNKLLKYLFIIINIFLILLTGLTRIYLNVHWFSDVLAGFALGIFWFTLSILLFRTFKLLSKKIRKNKNNLNN